MIAGIEENRARIFVGKDSKFLDFFYRLAPERAAKFISSKMKNRV